MGDKPIERALCTVSDVDKVVVEILIERDRGQRVEFMVKALRALAINNSVDEGIPVRPNHIRP